MASLRLDLEDHSIVLLELRERPHEFGDQSLHHGFQCCVGIKSYKVTYTNIVSSYKYLRNLTVPLHLRCIFSESVIVSAQIYTGHVIVAEQLSERH